MSRSARSRARGMSLLELLVAFSILAISLGVLYKAIGAGARSVNLAERYQRAALLGESLLAMRDAVPEGGWSENGQSAGYEWSVRSVPFATEASQRNPAVPVLHELEIEVGWRDQGALRTIRLHTLRPQRKTPAGGGTP